MKKITVNDISLAFDRTGTGSPLVLIHGYPLDHTIWNEVVPLLSPVFDLIIPDLRGFGESTSSKPQWSMQDLADDIAGVLDDQKIESAFLVGHSMGGYVALAFAKKFPGRVRGLALVASQTAADSPEKKADRIKQAGQISQDGTGEAVAGMTPKLSSDPKVQKTVHDIMKRQKPAGYIGSLHAMAGREDTLPMLADSDYPVILIHGDVDNLIPLQRAHDVQAAVPRAQLVQIHQAGHMPMMDAPKQVADALERFLV
jgi:pimeloyl-ACP methyl ester carboxylesterase